MATAHTTPGGIQFRHVTLAGQPRHAITFAWPDSISFASPGREGVAPLGRQLVNEGTAALNRNAFSERLKDIGAATSLFGNPYFTQGSVTAAPDKMRATVELFAGQLATPAMAPDRFAFLHKSAMANARQAAENAETLARRLMTRLTLGAGPAFDAIIHPAESFQAVTLADVEAWRRAVMVRDRVIVASAGPMAAEAVAAEIDLLFAGLPLRSAEQAVVAPPPLKLNPRLVVLERPVAQTIIVAGGPSGWTVGPDQPRADIVIQSLLGFEGRMFRALREKLGASYGVQASLITYHEQARAFWIVASVDSTKAADAIAAIRAEYERLIADGLTEAEVTRLKARQVTNLDEQFRQSLSAAQQLLRVQLGGFPADFLDKHDAQLASFDLAAINDGLRTKFPKAPLAFMVIAPKADGLGADCTIKSAEEIARCE